MSAQQEGGSPDELKRLIAESYAGGQLDPGEAGMLTGVFHLHEQEARQVMTPIPAVVTVDVSQDAQTALELCISSGHTRLVVIEGDDRDRVRGLVHCLLACQAADARRSPCLDRADHARRADRARDQAAWTTCWPICSASAPRWRSSSTSMGASWGSSRSRTSSRRSWARSPTRPTPPRARCAGWPDGDLFVRGHVSIADLLDYGVELPVDSDAYNSVGGFVFAELGRLPRRGDTISSGDFSIRVESVHHNRVEAVRIRSAAAARVRQAEPDEDASERRVIAPDQAGSRSGLPIVRDRPAWARRHWSIQRRSERHVRPAGGRAGACALGGGGCALRSVSPSSIPASMKLT